MGLGNTLLCDDGIGIYVSREIKNKIQDARVTVSEASIGGLELLDYLTGFSHAVLIDAVQTGKTETGSLIEFRPEDLQGGSAMDRHHVSLFHALGLGHHLEMDLPERIHIYGIETADTRTFQESCTPDLAHKIPEIAQSIIERENLIKK